MHVEPPPFHESAYPITSCLEIMYASQLQPRIALASSNSKAEYHVVREASMLATRASRKLPTVNLIVCLACHHGFTDSAFYPGIAPAGADMAVAARRQYQNATCTERREERERGFHHVCRHMYSCHGRSGNTDGLGVDGRSHQETEDGSVQKVSRCRARQETWRREPTAVWMSTCCRFHLGKTGKIQDCEACESHYGRSDFGHRQDVLPTTYRASE